MSTAAELHDATARSAARRDRDRREGFNAGETIIGHVANSSADHPLIHLPKVYGIDFSVTKHVFMIWLVAAVLFVVVTWIVRRLPEARAGAAGAATGSMNALEAVVEFVRDSIAQPNVGSKWVRTWTPLLADVLLLHPRRPTSSA